MRANDTITNRNVRADYVIVQIQRVVRLQGQLQGDDLAGRECGVSGRFRDRAGWQDGSLADGQTVVQCVANTGTPVHHFSLMKELSNSHKLTLTVRV